MKIKAIIVTAAGITAEAITAIALWRMSDMQIQDVIVWSVLAYMLTEYAAALILEHWEIHVRVNIRRRNKGPQLYNLREYPEWQDRRRE